MTHMTHCLSTYIPILSILSFKHKPLFLEHTQERKKKNEHLPVFASIAWKQNFIYLLKLFSFPENILSRCCR